MGLTIKPGSGLADMVKSNCMTYVCFDENDKIVGWAVTGDFIYTPAFMVYTRRGYRRRGIGAMLHRHAMKHMKGKRCQVFPDPQNAGYFRRLGYRVGRYL